VILDPQQDASAERPGNTPGVDRVHDVTEVQVSRGRGRKARDGWGEERGARSWQVGSKRHLRATVLVALYYWS
jgi:hypothetical protein